MEALRRIGLLALIISFLTINLCYGQNTAKQNWIKGVEYAAQGKFKEAKGEFEKALKVDPVYGSAKRALKVIEDVIGRKIKSKTAIRLFKGISYYNKEQWDESVAELTKAIEINPRYAYAYIGRGLAYGRKGQHDKAISDYTKAIEINPRYADAYVSRGVTYGKKRQHDQAISDFDKAIELNPRDAMAYYNRRITWEMKGNLDQAIADYTKAVEINPRCSKAYVNRAAIWLNKGDMERAIADFLKRAICFISNEEEFQTTLAALEGRSGRKGESGQSVVPFLGTEGSKGEWTPELL